MSSVLRSTCGILLFLLGIKNKEKALVFIALVEEINKNLKYKNVELFNRERNRF